MLIDLILDRAHDTSYNAREFYHNALAYEQDEVTRAMDGGTEREVQAALCDYIRTNDYNPEICAYVESVNWLTDWNASVPYGIYLDMIESTRKLDELNELIEGIADSNGITHREYCTLYAVAVIHSRCCE